MSRSNLKKNKKKIYVKIKCYLPELKYLESWRDFHKSDQMVCILITIGSPLAKFHTYIYFSIPTSPTSFLWWHDNFANVDLGSVWIQLILLKIDNWKHCNKIIFKCVNSTMWHFFNESFVEKRGLWVPWTVYGNRTHWNSINALQKKKKKKKKETLDMERKCAIRTDT